MMNQEERLKHITEEYSLDPKGLREGIECAGSESLSKDIQRALEEAYNAGKRAALVQLARDTISEAEDE